VGKVKRGAQPARAESDVTNQQPEMPVCTRDPQDIKSGQMLAVCAPKDRPEDWIYPTFHHGLRHNDRQIRGYTSKIIRLTTTSAHSIQISEEDTDKILKMQNLHTAERAKFWSGFVARFHRSQHGNKVPLDVLRFKPDDAAEEGFRELTGLLVEKSCTIYWWHASTASWDFLHRIDPRMGKRHVVSSLTLIFLVQRMYRSVYGASEVFSYAPAFIAEQLRQENLGELLGTRFTRKLLHCIFHRMYDQYPRADPTLLCAAADLLTAHLKRKDHAQLSKLGNRSGMLAQKLQGLFDFLDLSSISIDRTEPGITKLVVLVGRKIGIIYGAYMNFRVDMEREQGWDPAYTSAIIRNTGNVLGALIGFVPGLPANLVNATGAAVRGVADVTATITEPKLQNRQKLKDEISRMGRNFGTTVVKNAENGVAVATEFSRDGKMKIALEKNPALVVKYAGEARDTLKTVTDSAIRIDDVK
jgi:hypothetical protein